MFLFYSKMTTIDKQPIVALPYIDTEIEQNPQYRKIAENLIEEDIRISGGRDKLLNDYMIRLEQKYGKMEAAGSPQEPINVIELSRYDLADNKGAQSIDLACVALEYEHMKQTNLLLLSQVGLQTLKSHEKRLKIEAELEEQKLEKLKQSIATINQEREVYQRDLGSQLEDLSERWGSLAYNSAVLRGTLKQRDGDCPF
jgi:hypothetical protein